MEASRHLFQLDDDDIFCSDSFLEELEQVEQLNVASSVVVAQQRPHILPSAGSTLSPSPVTKDKGTPNDGAKKFSFRLRTSPTTPLPVPTDVQMNRDAVSSEETSITGGLSNQAGNTTSVLLTKVRHSNQTPRGVLKSLPSNIRPAGIDQLSLNSSSVYNRAGLQKPLSGGESNVSKNAALGSQSSHSSISPVSTSLMGMSQRSAGRGLSANSNREIGSVPLRPESSMPSNVLRQPPKQQTVPLQNQTSKNFSRTQAASGIKFQSGNATGTVRRDEGMDYLKSPMSTVPVSKSQYSPKPLQQNQQFSSLGYQGTTNGRRIASTNQNQGLTPAAIQGGRTVQGAGFKGHTPALHRQHNSLLQQGQMHTPVQRQAPQQWQKPSPEQRTTSHLHEPPRQMMSTPYGRQTATPTQRQVPSSAQRQTPTPTQRQTPTSKRQAAEQGRRVLTPRVAQLCQGSTPSSGPGSTHGVARKFPGPAGLLPKLNPGQKLKSDPKAIKVQLAEEDDQAADNKEVEPEVGDFEHGAWQRMKSELRITDSDQKSTLLHNNIALVIRKASLKQLSRNKVGNLCVMVKTISHHTRDASVTLCDPSGEMQGTIHRRLVEEHQVELRPGCVMVLRQIGVLSPSQRNHYLNITPSNLVRIFPPESSNGRDTSQMTPRRTHGPSPRTSSKSSPKGHPERTAVVSSEKRFEDPTPEPFKQDADMEAGNSWEELEGEWEVFFEEECDADIEDDQAISGREGLSGRDQDAAGSVSDSKGRITGQDDKVLDRSEKCYTLSSEELKEMSDSLNIPPTSSRKFQDNSLAPTLGSSSSTTLTYSSRLPSSSTTNSLIASSTTVPDLREGIKRSNPSLSSSNDSQPPTHPETTKKVCLMDPTRPERREQLGNECIGSDTHQKNNISDLLDGIEDELFDDF